MTKEERDAKIRAALASCHTHGSYKTQLIHDAIGKLIDEAEDWKNQAKQNSDGWILEGDIADHLLLQSARLQARDVAEEAVSHKLAADYMAARIRRVEAENAALKAQVAHQSALLDDAQKRLDNARQTIADLCAALEAVLNWAHNTDTKPAVGRPALAKARGEKPPEPDTNPSGNLDS